MSATPPPSGLAATVGLLACPHCGGPVRLEGRVVGCDRGHRFDVARKGYVNLLPGDARPARADRPEMVAARVRVLGAGHFGALTLALADTVGELVAGTTDGAIADLGAGPGHHLASVLDRAPRHVGIAFDLSKAAAGRAARAHPRMGAVVCDIWRHVPLRDAAAEVVLSVFAPRNPQEIARVLRPGGAAVIVTPTVAHLNELVAALDLLTVPPDKLRRLDALTRQGLAIEDRRSISYTILLEPGDVADVVTMGPSAWHVDPGRLHERLHHFEPRVEVTVAVELTILRRGGG